MIRIDIKSTDIRQVPFTYQRGPQMGKPGMMHKQEAWAHTVDREGKPHPYPQRVSIDLDSKTGQGPWPVGSYLISPSSFYVGSFGDLQMGRLQLVPMTQPVRAAA